MTAIRFPGKKLLGFVTAPRFQSFMPVGSQIPQNTQSTGHIVKEICLFWRFRSYQGDFDSWNQWQDTGPLKLWRWMLGEKFDLR